MQTFPDRLPDSAEFKHRYVATLCIKENKIRGGGADGNYGGTERGKYSCDKTMYDNTKTNYSVLTVWI